MCPYDTDTLLQVNIKPKAMLGAPNNSFQLGNEIHKKFYFETRDTTLKQYKTSYCLVHYVETLLTFQNAWPGEIEVRADQRYSHLSLYSSHLNLFSDQLDKTTTK